MEDVDLSKLHLINLPEHFLISTVRMSNSGFS